MTAIEKKSATSLHHEIAEKNREIAKMEKKIADLAVKKRAAVIDSVQKGLESFARSAPINASMSRTEASEVVQEYLVSARAIPLSLPLCEMMEEEGFDGAGLTPGSFQGQQVKFATGVSLLKFVGLLAKDAPELNEAEMLASLTDEDTKH